MSPLPEASVPESNEILPGIHKDFHDSLMMTVSDHLNKAAISHRQHIDTHMSELHRKQAWHLMTATVVVATCMGCVLVCLAVIYCKYCRGRGLSSLFSGEGTHSDEDDCPNPDPLQRQGLLARGNRQRAFKV